MRLSFKSFY